MNDESTSENWESKNWELLSAYFDGELEKAERRKMEQLLFENPEYAKVLTQWRELRTQMQALPHPTGNSAQGNSAQGNSAQGNSAQGNSARGNSAQENLQRFGRNEPVLGNGQDTGDRAAPKVDSVQAGGASPKQSQDLNQRIMERIAAGVAAGDVQWITESAPLEERFRLSPQHDRARGQVSERGVSESSESSDSQGQTGGQTSARKSGQSNWNDDFRRLSPGARMRRWTWQIAGIASVAALLLVSVFIPPQNQNREIADIDLLKREGVTGAGADSLAAGAGEPGPVLDPSSMERANVKSANDPAKSNPAESNPAVLARSSDKVADPFGSPDRVTGERAVGSADSADLGVSQSLEVAVSDASDSDMPELRGIVVYEIDDPALRLTQLRDTLARNNFSTQPIDDYQKQFQDKAAPPALPGAEIGNLAVNTQQSKTAAGETGFQASDLAGAGSAGAANKGEIDPSPNGGDADVRLSFSGEQGHENLPTLVITGDVEAVSNVVNSFRDQGNAISFIADVSTGMADVSIGEAALNDLGPSENGMSGVATRGDGVNPAAVTQNGASLERSGRSSVAAASPGAASSALAQARETATADSQESTGGDIDASHSVQADQSFGLAERRVLSPNTAQPNAAGAQNSESIAKSFSAEASALAGNAAGRNAAGGNGGPVATYSPIQGQVDLLSNRADGPQAVNLEELFRVRPRRAPIRAADIPGADEFGGNGVGRSRTNGANGLDGLAKQSAAADQAVSPANRLMPQKSIAQNSLPGTAENDSRSPKSVIANSREQSDGDSANGIPSAAKQVQIVLMLRSSAAVKAGGPADPNHIENEAASEANAAPLPDK